MIFCLISTSPFLLRLADSKEIKPKTTRPSLLSPQCFSLMCPSVLSKVWWIPIWEYHEYEILILQIHSVPKLVLQSLSIKVSVLVSCGFIYSMISALEVKENFLIFCIAWARGSSAFPELWITFIFFQVIGGLRHTTACFEQLSEVLWPNFVSIGQSLS